MSQVLSLDLFYILGGGGVWGWGGGKEPNYPSNLKFSGVYITENLKWYTHIQYLCYNLSKIFYVIKSLQDIVKYTHFKKYICHNISFSTKMQYNFLGWRVKQQNSPYTT